MATHWPEPLVAEPVARDRGPVLILIEVEKEHRSAFLRALDHLSHDAVVMVPMLALSSPVDLPPDRGAVNGYGLLTMICHSFLLEAVLLPPLSRKNLGRETLSPALFYVLRRAGSPR
jgi:hypothetical protein